MVPSDPRSSLLPGRHARPERGFGMCVRPCLCSPRRLLGCRGSTLRQMRSTSIPKEPASRSGLSLPCSGCPFPGPLCRITVPGLPLRGLAVPPPDPFGGELRTSWPDCRPRGASTLTTRCPGCDSAIPMLPRALLPFGTFRSLRLNARPDSVSGSSLGRYARPPSLPEDVVL